MQSRLFVSLVIGWRYLALVCALALLAAGLSATAGAPEEGAPPRILIIGDSTVCDYPATSPCRGWGQFIEENFKPGVKVLNRACSGRSTKTFIREGRWKAGLAEKPDFVLIQFGHNDSHAGDRPESTDAATDFRDYLRAYIDESRAAHATPILVTPMHRRIFAADGTLTDALQPYAAAMEAVAGEKKVPLIDLHRSSGELFAQLGDERSQQLASIQNDRTHFNEAGAKAMARLVMKELPRVEPRLAPWLAQGTAASEPGS